MSESRTVAALADFLCARKNEISHEWLTAVHRDAGAVCPIPDAMLADHLPQLFDSLTDDLRDGGGAARERTAAEYARAHGNNRWEQRCKIEHVLREVALLQDILLRHVAAYHGTDEQLDGKTDASARQLVRKFFERMTLESATEFASRTREELEESGRATESLNAALQSANAQL